MVGNIDLGLIDSLHSVQSYAREENSKQEVFISEDIGNLLERCLQVMTLGAHGHIFFAWLEFGGCYQTLPGQEEVVPREGLVQGEEDIVP